MLAPIEPAILARAHPFIIRAGLNNILEHEAEKGRQAEISDTPVPLEPTYMPLRTAEEIYEAGGPAFLESDPPPPSNTWMRFRIWLSPEQPCDWCRSELLVKHFADLSRRAAWEILGNDEGISFRLLCHPEDAPLIRAAFGGQFAHCRITEQPDRGLLAAIPGATWAGVDFREFFPESPYFRLMTRPPELKRSPYASLLAAMAMIPQPAIGLYQVLFAPVCPNHNWRQNVEFLQDAEFKTKLLHGLTLAQRFAQQAPSGDLRQMSMDLENKAHNDKPFFAAVLRVAVIGAGAHSREFLRSFDALSGLLQYGGRPLSRLNAEKFRARLSTESIRRMFVDGLSHRRGFLVNSEELSGIVHVPPPETMTEIAGITTMLETLPSDGSLNEGTPIGYSASAGSEIVVCIPYGARPRHTHLIGRPGTGKTSVMEGMILDDVGRGVGLAVLDPHGDLCERLLCLIPAEAVERTIYLDPGDPDWIPLWNPFGAVAAHKAGDVTDGMIDVFKSFVDNWGDRLEHILRNLFIALLSQPRGTLLDVADLLRPKAQGAEELRRRFEEAVDDLSVQKFLREELAAFRNDELSPPRNKLSKLLLAGSVSLMLSQPDSAFHLGEVMDQGKILLVNLSRIGSQVRGIVGSLLVSLFRQETLRRSEVPEAKRREFHMYCDEFQRFVTDSLEDMIAEARKYKVGLTLAHQYMRQFDRRKGDALSTVGSTIIFGVDRADAEYLTKDLLGMVRTEDLIAQPDFRALARIGQQVVRIRTYKPPEITGTGHRDQIIERSRRLYCKPAAEVVARIRRRRAELGQLAPTPRPSGDRRTPNDTQKERVAKDSGKGPGEGERRDGQHDMF